MKTHKRGKLIVLEGPDEVGKSSVVTGLEEWFRSQDIPVLSLSFPGKLPGSLGEHIYKLHHNREEFGLKELSVEGLQLLHVAAHLESIRLIILPALHAGRTVLLDRFWWSTLAYGIVGGGNSKVLRAMIAVESLYWGEVLPDAVFLLSRSRPFVEVEDIGFWRRIVDEYEYIAKEETFRHDVATVSSEAGSGSALRVIIAKIERYFAKGATSNGSVTKVASTPNVYTSLSPAKPTQVYDTYWRFAAERQEIFFKKILSNDPPWSNDPILSLYKFTNAYRASDRVSQYLIKNVIYRGSQNTDEIFFRVLLFKTFNRIGTWELLQRELGQISSESFDIERYDSVLSSAMAMGKKIYSGAYIMTSGKSFFGHLRKHKNHLMLLDKMLKDELPEKVLNAKSMKNVFELLCTYPTIGSFLAYQYTIDLNYSNLTSFSEMEFVVPGPGAKDGIRKCFSDYGGLSETDLIHLVTERQNMEFERMGIKFKSLWGRSLQLIDCQNLFCEVDKYARVAHPDSAGLSGRKRIKQKYGQQSEPIEYWYPPKWGLNQQIGERRPDVPHF